MHIKRDVLAIEATFLHVNDAVPSKGNHIVNKKM